MATAHPSRISTTLTDVTIGVHKCYSCRKPFRVTVGNLFEASHIKLHLWLQAITLRSSSKKGISTHQLHRTLGIGIKAAWFLAHRIRGAMCSGELAPMGGHGGIVEADETYFGKLETPRRLTRKRPSPLTKGGKVGPGDKRTIVSVVERGGSVRSFHVAASTAMDASMSPCTSQSGMPPASMSAVMFTPTRPRAISACSSVG